MKAELIVGNSFSKLVGFKPSTMAAVDEILTYQNDIEHEKIYLKGQIEFWKAQSERTDRDRNVARRKWGYAKKQFKDLLASEFVKWLRDDQFPTGHLNIVRDVLAEFEPRYNLTDQRVRPERRHEFILCKDFHEPRYYQREAHEAAMAEGRGVVESAVGTGKTDIMMRLVFELGVNSLIIVPSKPLLTQTLPILKEHFGQRQVVQLGSAEPSRAKLRKLRKKPIRVATIHQVAAALKKGTLAAQIEDVEALFIDEIHHAGSKSYTDLMASLAHVFHRFGFTGTFLRNDSKTLDLWGFLSTVLYRYPAHLAIKDGHLTPITMVTHEIEGVEKRAYQSEYRANYCGGKKKRPEKLLKKIHEILRETKPDDQVLILVNRKDQCGRIIHDFLQEKGVKNTYISGDSDDETIAAALRGFNERKVKILIGSQVIGEGIDIRTTDHLIMAQGGKSEIAIVQAVGRLVRLSEGKLQGFLHDFLFSNTKYMRKHYHMRRDICKRNFSPKFKAG